MHTAQTSEPDDPTPVGEGSGLEPVTSALYARLVRIAIIGAGFAGLGAAIRLRQAGIDDFEILERSHDLGGTWRDNSYPGCAVDVQSHLYSYSFAPNPDWSHVYSPQEEIWSYIGVAPTTTTSRRTSASATT